MSRHLPTETEQRAIDLLVARGYAVYRAGTIQNLRNRVFLAEHLAKWETEQRECTQRRVESEFAEYRRLADRLDRVVAAAAAQGVTIRVINAALDGD